MLASIPPGEEVIIETDGFAVAARKDSLVSAEAGSGDGAAETVLVATEAADATTTPKVAMVSPEEKPDPGWVGFALPTTLPGLEGASDATAEILHFPESLRPATVAAGPEKSDEGVATVVAKSTFEIASPVTVIEVKVDGKKITRARLERPHRLRHGRRAAAEPARGPCGAEQAACESDLEGVRSDVAAKRDECAARRRGLHRRAAPASGGVCLSIWRRSTPTSARRRRGAASCRCRAPATARATATRSARATPAGCGTKCALAPTCRYWNATERAVGDRRLHDGVGDEAQPHERRGRRRSARATT